MGLFPTILIFFLAFLIATAAPVYHLSTAPAARTALAVIHESDGIWGSVVFRQAGRGMPVLVTASFSNVKTSGGAPVDWGLFSEPVHYENAPHTRCSSALRGVLRAHGESIGALGRKHGHIRGRRFSTVGYDSDLSLYPEDAGYIVQRSLAVRQGDGPDEHACATVYRVEMDFVHPGAVPCELARYSDCAVSAGGGRCKRLACEGYRQFWGIRDRETSAIDEHTTFCVQRDEVAPTVMGERVAQDGTVACELGRHTNLYPLSRSY